MRNEEKIMKTGGNKQENVTKRVSAVSGWKGQATSLLGPNVSLLDHVL